jgi:hypothetical protein
MVTAMARRSASARGVGSPLSGPVTIAEEFIAASRPGYWRAADAVRRPTASLARVRGTGESMMVADRTPVNTAPETLDTNQSLSCDSPKFNCRLDPYC